MSEVNNMPVPDFADEDSQAVQVAQNALKSGRNKPLTVPASAEVFVSKTSGAKYSRFTEEVTIEQAYRSVTKDGSKMDIALMLKVRQSEVNSGRTFWAHFYIAPTTVGLNEKQIEYREKQRGLMFGVIRATGFVPESGRLLGSLQATCFPQAGEPGKASVLVGANLFAEISQVDRKATDKNGQVILNEDGVAQREIKDEIEGWVAATVEE